MSKKLLTPARIWSMRLADEASHNAFRDRFYELKQFNNQELEILNLLEDAALFERECHKPAPMTQL